MKKLLTVMVLSVVLSPVAMAQVGTTIKEGAKATAQKAEELGDDVKASTESGAKAAATEAKAKAHHAKAHKAAKKAKQAAEEIPK